MTPESDVVFNTSPPSNRAEHLERNSKREARLPRFLGRAIFFCILFLIVLTAIPYGSVEFWWASFFELGIFAITALWIVEALLSGGWRWQRQGWLIIPPILLILFSLLQSIPLSRAAAVGSEINDSVWNAISADPFQTQSFALRLLALTLLGMLLLRFTTNRRRLYALVLTVIGVGAMSAIFGILRQTMQHEAMGFGLPALPVGIGYGQIISRNQFAFMMEMALGLALGMMFQRRGRYETSLFYLSLALPLGAALILANSRGGILTMICQLLFLSLLVVPVSLARKEQESGDRVSARLRRLLGSVVARAVLVLALTALVSVAIVWIGGERVVSNLSTVPEELQTEDAGQRWNTRRMDIWRATLKMIKEHPLVGVGFGGYWTAIPQYHDASGEYTPQQAHNDYLELLASGGVVGLALVIWFILILVKRIRKVLLGGDAVRRAACLGALVGLFGVAVHSLFDFGLHLTINAALLVALIALATADIQGGVRKEIRNGE